jgi:hypothetical protein
MGTDLMPLSLVAKLLGALALCFGLMVAAAWALRRHWPSLGRALDAKREDKGLQVLQSRGLGPGAALHLIEVDGARILVLQGKERSDVIWSRDDEKLLDQACQGAAFEAAAPPPAAPSPAPAAFAPYAAWAPTAVKAAPEDAWEPEAAATLDALAATLEAQHLIPGKAKPAAPAQEGLDPAALQARHDRNMDLQRERQRRYRERHRQLAQAQGVLLFPGPTGTRR